MFRLESLEELLLDNQTIYVYYFQVKLAKAQGGQDNFLGEGGTMSPLKHPKNHEDL